MPSGSSRPSKPKPQEIASETKRRWIPTIRDQYAHTWKTYSYIYLDPLRQLNFVEKPINLSPPQFYIYTGDPVDTALNWAKTINCQIPFICPANDKRPGGDWETGVAGYEERLCRRSTLSATMATPAPDQDGAHYPIPDSGALVSSDVVVFRGPHDKYDMLPFDQWQALPVVSMTPARRPKLTQNGTKYSFANERAMVRDKLRAALRICVYNEYSSVVVGDFGLGSYRNPPLELAEIWREVMLYDPDLRGRLAFVAFVFEDPSQSTAQLILDDLQKKAKGKPPGASSSASSSSTAVAPTDFQIFSQVFDNEEIKRFLGQPDARYGLNNLLAE
ncbi:hypothetical protein B0T24DRAFT_225843 [Lasiosphaeria ovina]|uniref:Microbial-type PARG catalytic domain-containing protein n=1 Tax=Lasiosphaeria ovina TaxID=92902 RepID=A0AAE0KI41_9PEZI|nr:hypothetical protein B0T24DRAFT_225843 [Lasiosphaeria ovina]